MMRERRGRTDIIAQILEGAKKGKTIGKITTEHGVAWNQFVVYMSILTELELVRIEKPAEYFKSEDGRDYNLLYITTEKGLCFIKHYKALMELLGEENNSHKVIGWQPKQLGVMKQIGSTERKGRIG